MGARDYLDGEVNTLGKRLLLNYLVQNKTKELETILQSDNEVKTAVPQVEEVGQMIQLVATVTKTSQTELFVWRKNVKCVKCRVSFPMTADLTQFNTVPLSGKSQSVQTRDQSVLCIDNLPRRPLSKP